MLSTLADFPFFNDRTATTTSLRRMGVIILCVCLGTVQYRCISSGLVIVQLKAVFCPSIQYPRSFVRYFPERPWLVVALPCFEVVKSFTSGYALLLLFFLIFSSVSLYCSPILFFCCCFCCPFSCTSWCCCSLPCIPQILQAQIFSLSVLSFCHTDEEFLQWPRVFFFLLTLFTKDLTGCLSHCCVEGGDHWIHVCIFIIHDGERCKLPAYHSLEGFQHVGIFQLFEESYVFWLADFFSGEGGRSSSSSRDHFQCLLLENFVFWHCWLEIGSFSSLECNQSGCGVVHLGYAMSIF